jgi:hypothetical protein
MHRAWLSSMDAVGWGMSLIQDCLQALHPSSSSGAAADGVRELVALQELALAGPVQMTSFALPPRCSVVLYTDGLIGDRCYTLDRGLAELSEATRCGVTESQL